MSDKKRALLRLAPVGLLFAALCLYAWCKPADAYSLTERRQLSQWPGVTADSVLNGSFMSKFEDYAADQFPLREGFRRMQSFIRFYLLGQKDVNDIYIAGGSAAKIEEAIREDWVQANAEKLKELFERYFAPSGSQAYFALVPGKDCYLAEEYGYPGTDYDRLTEVLREAADFAGWIDLRDCLTIEDYYTTDSHWRQERILPVAQALADAMGADIAREYQQVLAREDFVGVYAGQSALPLAAEPLYYLTSPALENATLYDYERDETTRLYDLEGVWGRDPYDLFLHGASPLQVLENPGNDSGRELVLFRDSFGSSLSPLLLEGYSRITLVDLRYIRSDLLSQYVPAEGQDVLFLYSPAILNSVNLLK